MIACMPETPSTMLAIGTPLPTFQLPDYNGRRYSERDFASSAALLVAFVCPHCPYVKHIRQELARFAKEYAPRGLAVVAINSNDPIAFPEDDVAGMKQEAETVGYTFPYLFDAGQDVAKAFQAACTPDFFLFDKARRLAYRGQFDDSRPGKPQPVTGADLRSAADAVLANRAVPEASQRPSVGCNIKWKQGAAPAYAGQG
jgi:thiol-disulfide isomerase/thioredoxin